MRDGSEKESGEEGDHEIGIKKDTVSQRPRDEGYKLIVHIHEKYFENKGVKEGKKEKKKKKRKKRK